MESQVCVHCLNKKPINATTNRLVTESCGHVKCMDCLIREEAGCVACAENKAVGPYGAEIKALPNESLTSENEVPQVISALNRVVIEENKEGQIENLDEGKKKLDMSHIKVIIGMHYFFTLFWCCSTLTSVCVDLADTIQNAYSHQHNHLAQQNHCKPCMTLFNHHKTKNSWLKFVYTNKLKEAYVFI